MTLQGPLGSSLGPYLTEYEALRAEFLHRLSAQQRVEQTSFATVAAAVALGAATRGSAEVLAAIAFIATILFCLLIFEFNSHREKITMIFRYFVRHLYPRIRTMSQGSALRWDAFWLGEAGLPRQLSRIPLPDTGAVLYVLALASVIVGLGLMPEGSDLLALAIVAALFVGFALLVGVLNGLLFERYRREALAGRLVEPQASLSGPVPVSSSRRSRRRSFSLLLVVLSLALILDRILRPRDDVREGARELI